MKHKFIFSIFAGLVFFGFSDGCAVDNLKNDKSRDTYEYSESTESLKPSADRLDEGRTFEVYFTLEKPVECISVGLEAVYLQKKFPVQSIPKKSYFVVEKILEVPGTENKKGKIYVPSGRNYDSNWEVHSPVKICSSKNDPVSSLDRSVFRMRFTTFDDQPFYFTVTVLSPVKIIFSTDPAALKDQQLPVK